MNGARPFTPAATRFLDGPSGRFAYRRGGPPYGTPLVLFQRFRGVMDDWDPALLDILSIHRDVIVFDNLGVGLSSGEVPSTVSRMADGALEFLSLLELDEADLLGWSMGGFIVQAVALAQPSLVRRLIVAGSKPGLVPGAPTPEPEVGQVAGKPVNDTEDLLYLFFPPSVEGREAGLASIARIAGLAENPSMVVPAGVQAQSQALTSWSAGVQTAWDRLEELTMPILVAAGAQDRLMDAFHSYAMVRRLPNANLLIYGDAGHAFLFQHALEFGRAVLDFVR